MGATAHCSVERAMDFFLKRKLSAITEDLSSKQLISAIFLAGVPWQYMSHQDSETMRRGMGGNKL